MNRSTHAKLPQVAQHALLLTQILTIKMQGWPLPDVSNKLGITSKSPFSDSESFPFSGMSFRNTNKALFLEPSTCFSFYIIWIPSKDACFQPLMNCSSSRNDLFVINQPFVGGGGEEWHQRSTYGRDNSCVFLTLCERSSNQYSLEPIYDKAQAGIRLFNILYWPPKEKHRHKFIKKSHLLRNDA